MNNDTIVKALTDDGTVRVYAAVTTALVAQAQHNHDTWATASAALGRALTGTLLLGATLKGTDNVSITIDGGGALGGVVTHADAHGHTRGYVREPHVDFPQNAKGKLDVARAVGQDGFLSVTKDQGLKDNFTGQVPLQSGEIGDDFTYYFAASEQIPSSVGLGVIVNPDHSIQAAGGLLLQIMPGAEASTVDQIEQRIQESPSISHMVAEGYTPNDMIAQWLGDRPFHVLDTMAAGFVCQCSKERFARGLASLKKEEIAAMIAEDGGAEVTCQFCQKTYWFDRDELEQIQQ